MEEKRSSIPELFCKTAWESARWRIITNVVSTAFKKIYKSKKSLSFSNLCGISFYKVYFYSTVCVSDFLKLVDYEKYLNLVSDNLMPGSF